MSPDELTTTNLDDLIYLIIALSEQGGNPHPRSAAWVEVTRRFNALEEKVKQLQRSGKVLVDAIDGKLPDLSETTGAKPIKGSMKLSDRQLLAGEIGTLTMTEFRAAPGDALLQVELGKMFTITKNGKAIAILSPPESSALELGAEIRRRRLG